jgi:hypothetical protein
MQRETDCPERTRRETERSFLKEKERTQRETDCPERTRRETERSFPKEKERTQRETDCLERTQRETERSFLKEKERTQRETDCPERTQRETERSFLKEKEQRARSFLKEKEQRAGNFLKEREQRAGNFLKEREQRAGNFLKEREQRAGSCRDAVSLLRLADSQEVLQRVMRRARLSLFRQHREMRLRVGITAEFCRMRARRVGRLQQEAQRRAASRRQPVAAPRMRPRRPIRSASVQCGNRKDSSSRNIAADVARVVHIGRSEGGLDALAAESLCRGSVARACTELRERGRCRAAAASVFDQPGGDADAA